MPNKKFEKTFGHIIYDSNYFLYDKNLKYLNLVNTSTPKKIFFNI